MLPIQQIVLLGIKDMKLWMWHWTDMLDRRVWQTQKVAPNSVEWPIRDILRDPDHDHLHDSRKNPFPDPWSFPWSTFRHPSHEL